MRAIRIIRNTSALVLSFALAYGAHPTTPGCGTYGQRTREELYLHSRSETVRASRGRLKPFASTPRTVARDSGDVAVIDDSDGVVARRNEFNLNRKTVVFTPAVPDASSYNVASSADSYDAALAASGQKLQLGDDDSEAVPLPFTFPFYGAAYRSVYVNSDGNLTFGGSFEL